MMIGVQIMECELCGRGARLLLDKCINNHSLTSDSRITKTVSSQLFFCSSCGYAFTRSDFGSSDFYTDQYDLLLANFFEDQVLFLPKGRILNRNHYQAELISYILGDVTPRSALEMGSGKGLTSYHFLSRNADLNLTLQDPGLPLYGSMWATHFPKSNAVATLGELKDAQFDLIYSFFVFEHVNCPKHYLDEALQRLNEGGLFFACVPDVELNWGDLLVSDHLRHFSLKTLCAFLDRNVPKDFVWYAWRDAMLRSVCFIIARSDNFAAFQLPGKKDGNSGAGSYQAAIDELWIVDKAREIASDLDGKELIFWGSGFYARLVELLVGLEPLRVVDGNPYFQGKLYQTWNGASISIEDPASLADIDRDICKIVLCMSPPAVNNLLTSLDEKRHAAVYRIF